MGAPLSPTYTDYRIISCTSFGNFLFLSSFYNTFNPREGFLHFLLFPFFHTPISISYS